MAVALEHPIRTDRYTPPRGPFHERVRCLACMVGIDGHDSDEWDERKRAFLAEHVETQNGPERAERVV